MQPDLFAPGPGAETTPDLRRVHPLLRLGTASDRYAAWEGQVYPAGKYEVSTRKKTLGKEKYEERTLPVESTEDYFRHFSVVELDFTFYRPLYDERGEPTNNALLLADYAEHAPPEARFLLKAPQAFTARVLRLGDYVENPAYLDAAGFNELFLGPAVSILGDRLAGVIFEQEYGRVRETPPPEEFVAELDVFTSTLPPGAPQLHFEIRSPHLLQEPYFAWLETQGHGFVFSHWTWLPPLHRQWKLAGKRFTAANGEAVVRLLTPLNVKYEDAYRQAYPFDKPVPALAESDGAKAMIEDTTELAFEALDRGKLLNVVLNNRAYGNAPALAEEVVRRIREGLGA